MVASSNWPGNIRQLRNLAEVIAYSEAETIDTTDIAEAMGEHEQAAVETGFLTIPDKGTLKQMESEIVRNLMGKMPTSAVCSRLGISRATLWRKLQSLGA